MESLLMLLFQALGYGRLLNTGKALVFILSLGRWRSERVLSTDRTRFRLAGSLAERVGERVLVSENGQMLLGVCFYAALGVWLFHRFAG